MFKLFKACARVAILGKLMSFIVPILLKLFWRMEEWIKTELNPLIRIFLEVIKINKLGVRGISLGSSPYCSETSWERNCFMSSYLNLCKEAVGADTGLLLKPTISSSVRWNAVLSGYPSLRSGGCCVAQSNTSRAAVCPFVSAQEKKTTGYSSVACKMISMSSGGEGGRRCDEVSERDG